MSSAISANSLYAASRSERLSQLTLIKAKSGIFGAKIQLILLLILTFVRRPIFFTLYSPHSEEEASIISKK
jgi:hypothetical protein